MNREERLKVLAGLDGLQQNHYLIQCERGAVKRYLTSYDAIIPLIQKQSRATLARVVLSFKGQNDVSRMVDWLQYTPEQLADALIKAVGKWRD